MNANAPNGYQRSKPMKNFETPDCYDIYLLSKIIIINIIIIIVIQLFNVKLIQSIYGTIARAQLISDRVEP